ncbi:MAG: tRNA (adenosine(37)-N6)-dimethylallyltransferase MiaA [Lachnospiraceae bacterium]|nr:tRNA (adenosine(37)-N6)-dimethylallyltransferase MiaA [Lachnospiraceae bacterium]
MKQPLVILSGPTACGKTSLSIALAKRINAEIISADSMQVYRGFDIGTAKVTEAEKEGIPHYLIDELDPEEEFNVFEFQSRARNYICDITSRGKIPMIVGGTGFYIQSVLYDIDFSEESEDKTYRHELEKTAIEKGNDFLYQKLLECDPDAAKEIHPNNRKRVIRALEYFHETGQQISEHNRIQHMKESPYNFAYFVLNRPRNILYERINQRVDQMIKDGLTEEVSGLLQKGYGEDLLSMQGLGYKEMVPYVKGNMTMEAAIDLLKKNTRHFAKRQITWFKREKDVIWIDLETYASTEDALEYMVQVVKEKNIVCLS